MIVFTAGGKELRLQPLKKLAEQQDISTKGMVAMSGATKRVERVASA